MNPAPGNAVAPPPFAEAESPAEREPYLQAFPPAEVFGFSGIDNIRYHRHQGEGAATITEAADRFAENGIVVPSPNLPLGDTGETLGSHVEKAIAPTLEALKEHRHNPDVVAPKKYAEPTYGTLRRLFTVAPDKVRRYFSAVVDLQADLLQIVRDIARDDTIETSVDEAEATVINAQFFKLGADPNSFQQHGAHADRVDRTAVVCMENIGPHGELVVVDGYAEACVRLDLDPDRNFNANLNTILRSSYKDSITFKVHPVKAGTVVILDSTNYHFITAKSLSDVLAGISENPSRELNFVDEAEREIIGRAIINMAFESAECRELHKTAIVLMDRYDLHKVDKNRDKFFERLDQAVADFREHFEGPETERDRLAQLVRRAIVTKGTANRLYGKEATSRVARVTRGLGKLFRHLVPSPDQSKR